jgi:hypothetical protein
MKLRNRKGTVEAYLPGFHPFKLWTLFRFGQRLHNADDNQKAQMLKLLRMQPGVKVTERSENG